MKKQAVARPCGNLVAALILVLAMSFSVASRPAQAQFLGCENPGEQMDLPQVQCEALVALYNSTVGASWNDNTGWLQTATPCSWFGVTCNGGGVLRLELAGNNLNGPLPGEIGDLSEALELFFANNSLSGPVPPELGNLSNLTQLFLGGNGGLNGSIPPELGNLSNLTVLTLYGNALTGPVPVALGQLTSLAQFWLHENQLSDPVPLPVAQVGASAGSCQFGNNTGGLCFPDTPAYQALADVNDQICGVTLDPSCPAVTIYSETLGSPTDIDIASGTGIVAAGTGMKTQPGLITIDVPGDVQQVLLYWEGQSRRFPPSNPIPLGDETIIVNDKEVAGRLIGGPTNIFNENPGTPDETEVYSSVYRADITGLGLISAGANALTVKGLTFDRIANGAGILVIFDDGSALAAELNIREGQDWAYQPEPDPLDRTEPQTFTFAAEPFVRIATLPMFFSSVKGTVSGGGFRPTSIEVTIDQGLASEAPATLDVVGAQLDPVEACGVLRTGEVSPVSDLLDSCDGEEWDTVVMEVMIPAEATSLTVHPFSRDDNPGDEENDPASFNWLAAGFALSPDEVGCELTLAKECAVVAEPVGLECTDKVAATTLRYIGPDLAGATVEVDPDKGPTVVYSNVDLVSGTTILTMPSENDFTIDARPEEQELGSKTKIRINGIEEVLHTSCSTPYVAGEPAPLDNPKGDPSPNWFVENFVDKDSPDLVAVLEQEFSSTCEAELGTPPSCQTEGKPKSLTFVYTGGTCADSDNGQPSDKFSCEDDPLNPFDPLLPAEIVMTKDADKISVTPSMVDVGEQFTIARTDGKDFAADTELEIRQGMVIQDLKFHTSCSQPLAAGDVFGALELVGFSGQSAGAEVMYRYTVTNIGNISLTGLTLEDMVLGGGVVFTAGPFSLDVGETRMFKNTQQFSEIGTTENQAEVFFEGAVCATSGAVSVTITEPEIPCVECGFNADNADKVSELTLKYTPEAGTPDPATIIVYNDDKQGEEKNRLLTMMLSPNQEFTIEASTIGKAEFSSKVGFYREDPVTGEEEKIAELHTSCSDVLGEGTTEANQEKGQDPNGHADFRVEAGEDKAGAPLCPAPPPPECLACGFGDNNADKVSELTLEYTPEVGTPDPATIIVYNDDKQGEEKNRLLTMMLSPNQEFTIKASDADRNEFSSKVGFYALIAGEEVKIAELHTSCSDVLGPGTTEANQEKGQDPNDHADFEVVGGLDKAGIPQCEPPPDLLAKLFGAGGVDALTPQQLEAVPTEFSLEAAYPNPFNPVTTLRYGLPEGSDVRLVVYDVLGRRVEVLVDGQMPAGMHTVEFDASRLPSGTYFYRIETAFGTETRTMVLAK